MKISCPRCGFSRDVNPDQVPDRPVRVTCPSCGDSFTFDKAPPGRTEPEAPPVPEPAAPAAEQTTCPACGLLQPAGDACHGCGLIYAKWRVRQQTRQAGNVEQEPAGSTAFQGSLPGPGHAASELSVQARPKAGFWIRLVAYCIDAAIVSLAQFALIYLLDFSLGMAGSVTGQGQVAISVVSGLLGATISFAYGVFFIGYCGQTPAKMLLGIKVIRTGGAEMNYGRAVLREVLGKFVSGILLGIGFLMVAFDSQKQGLHDKIADTYVIKL